MVPDLAGPLRQAGRGPYPERAEAREGGGHGGARTAQAAQVDGARPGPRIRLLGIPRPGPDHPGVLRGALRPGLPHPRRRNLAGPGRPGGSLRPARTRGHLDLRDPPRDQQPGHAGPGVPVLRLAHQGRMADPLHDLPGRRDPVLVPRRAVGARQPAVRERRVRLGLARLPDVRSQRHHAGVDRDGRGLGADRRGAGVPRDRAELQAPAYRRRARQRLHIASPERARSAAADLLQGRTGRLRGSAGRRHLRQGPHRGLHVEGLRRLHGVHRVRPLPVAVPGMEHRQAPVAEAHDHGPARHDVHAGALPDGRRRRAPRAGRDARGRPGVGLAPRSRSRSNGRSSAHARAASTPRTTATRSTATAPPARSCRSSTRTRCGRAPRAGPASTSARSTSSTSITSSTCAATR